MAKGDVKTPEEGNIKVSDFFKNLPNLKILVWLIGAVVVLTLSLYGAFEAAVRKSNINSEEALEKIDRLTLIVQANIRYQASKDSLDQIYHAETNAILAEQTEDIKELKRGMGILKEAAKVNPPLYASITYLTQLVERTTEFEKKSESRYSQAIQN